MISKNTLSSVACAAFLLVFSSSLSHGAYYMLHQGEFATSFSLTHTTFDEFWAGDVKQPGVPGGGDIDRLSYRVYVDYGLSDTFKADFSVGYADVDANLGSQDDFTDVFLGMSWQFIEETSSMPDIMLRLGATIQGSYDVGQLSAPGDGASGFDLSTTLGKTLTDWGLRGEFALGYSFKSEEVPDNFWYKLKGIVPVGNGFSLDGGYSYFTGIDGIDIGGPGFTGLGDLPLVEEEAHILEVGLAFDSGDFGYYRLVYSEVIDGRNIGVEQTVGLSASFAF